MLYLPRNPDGDKCIVLSVKILGDKGYSFVLRNGLEKKGKKQMHERGRLILKKSETLHTGDFFGLALKYMSKLQTGFVTLHSDFLKWR